MPYRGWAELNGTELANSSRVIEHVGVEVPTRDLGILSSGADCSLVPMRPNLTANPEMTDPAIWPRTGSTGGTIVLTPGGGSLTLTGGGTTSSIAYLYGTSVATGIQVPRDTTSQIRVRLKVTVPADAPAALIPFRLTLRCDDSTAVNTAVYINTAGVNVARGTSQVLEGLLTAPVGYDRVRPRVELLSSAPANTSVQVSEPEIDRTTDPAMPGLFQIPSSSIEMMPGIWSPPDGARLWGPGLYEIGQCWDTSTLCRNCRSVVDYDDSWPGLMAFLGDVIYRPEIAPWYTSRIPESAEFGGVWVMDIQGLDAPGIERQITEMIGDGGAAGPARTPSRQITFDAVLLACSNAGLTYGLDWLKGILRETNKRTDSTLRYLAAHPGYSAADPASLLREVHGVVLTDGPTIRDSINAGNKQNQQATAYRVSFTLTATRPHAYSPPISFPVVWDTTAVRPISWVHAADCRTPADCQDMPVMFSATCDLETIEVKTSPPPSCGGCMPVGTITERVFTVPTFDYPMRSPVTVVDLDIHNTGGDPLTLQGFWRICNSNERCDDRRWPVQVSGLPPATELHLDGVSGRQWIEYDDRRWRPASIVSTFSGAPWRPPVIDRASCWEFVVIAPASATFDITMTLRDRDAE